MLVLIPDVPDTFPFMRTFFNISFLCRIGEPIVWDFIRNEWDYLVERFTLNDRLFGKIMPTITSRYSNSVQIKKNYKKAKA